MLLHKRRLLLHDLPNGKSVHELPGCHRVYAIAFGDGARHPHLHFIPRFAGTPHTEAWAVADLYREVQSGARPSSADSEVRAWIEDASHLSLSLMG